MPRNRVFAYNGDDHPSKAKQEFQRECDINVIVDMYKKGAPLPVHISEGQFVDVSELGDYKTALETMMEAERVWDTLPKVVKDAAGGTPAAFIDFVNDPANAEQLVELGLIAKPEVPAPAVVEPALPVIEPAVAVATDGE